METTNTTTTTGPNMTSKRINLWDFDEVLARSLTAVSAAAAANPGVPFWKFWHDEELSTACALVTEAIEETWAMLATLPGEHWVLTARNGAAVEAWLDLHDRRGVFAHVVSTSHAVTKNIPAAQKKTFTIAQAMHLADEVHFFDDSPANLAAARRVCPGVVTHQM